MKGLEQVLEVFILNLCRHDLPTWRNTVLLPRRGDTILAKLLPLQQERYFYGEGFDKCHLLLRSRLHTVPGFCCQSWIVAITVFLHGHLDENDFKALE